ncbi:hypothetical protein Q8F55_004920 [Vanrija albida]|uniref:Uncharacterized protein n=1 Tax=Vanrija albida TaxID=181172 RepID=A0ABR3Q0H6_9TREE
MPDNLVGTLSIPRSTIYSSRLLKRHPTQLVRSAISKPVVYPIQSCPNTSPAQMESAIDRIVAIPHILEAIVAYSSRSTQVTLLRVCGELHRMAGKHIYRVIKLEQSETNPYLGVFHVLRGALVGTGDHPHLGGCCSTDSIVDDPSSTNPINKTYMPRVRAVAKVSGVTIGQIAGDVAFGTRCESTLKPYATNFKKSLLAKTEVITLGTHHSCFCGLLGNHHWARLFPKLNTVRLSPSKSYRPFVLNAVCDGVCTALASLQPRKIVFRNIDGNGIHGLRSDLARWNVVNLETVVWFLPTDAREYHHATELMASIYTTSKYHFKDAKIKMVFHGKHEGELGIREAIRRSTVVQRPVDPDYIIGIVRMGAVDAHSSHVGAFDPHNSPDDWEVPEAYQQSILRNCTVYGIGTLTFDPSSSVTIASYKQVLPGEVVDRKKIVHIIKKETTNMSLTGTTMIPPQPFILADWERVDENLSFRTLSSYNDDLDSRSAEINATD